MLLESNRNILISRQRRIIHTCIDESFNPQMVSICKTYSTKKKNLKKFLLEKFLLKVIWKVSHFVPYYLRDRSKKGSTQLREVLTG